MIKSFVTGAAAIAVSALAPLSAISGPYFNPEVNVGANADDGVGAATMELHIGAKGDGFYGQVGPLIQIPDMGDTELGVSGKAGYGFGPGYTELSVSHIDSDTTFNLKVGGSFDL